MTAPLPPHDQLTDPTAPAAFLYPSAGDPEPPHGVEVLLLTIGGTCTRGIWRGKDSAYMGWAPFPKRDKGKEAIWGTQLRHSYPSLGGRVKGPPRG